ncbi:MAG: type II secretion system F family protein [Pseudomonadota bacterium]
MGESFDPTLFMPIMVAMSVFAAGLAIAWPWLAPNEMSRRLKETLTGGARERIKNREAQAAARAAAQQQVGLRSKASEPLAKLITIFRITERLDDGEMVNKLQQAGYRGRAAAVKYLAFRIVCPMIFFGVGLVIAGIIMPPHMPVWQKAGAVVGSVVLGYFLPPLLLQNRIDKRKIEIGRVWPDAVDLLLICVETGMSIEHAFKKVAEEMASSSIELAKEMGLTNAELSYLQERRQAYENMAKRIDLDAVQAVTGCLIQSEKYGTSLGVSLRVLAQESREMRMAAAEKKAAALPPKLTVPMIVFFLPVLFAVIITPAAIQIIAQ